MKVGLLVVTWVEGCPINRPKEREGFFFILFRLRNNGQDSVPCFHRGVLNDDK